VNRKRQIDADIRIRYKGIAHDRPQLSTAKSDGRREDGFATGRPILTAGESLARLNLLEYQATGEKQIAARLRSGYVTCCGQAKLLQYRGVGLR
jgi:hypothetical protein